MFTLLLVDDEPIEREGLRLLINGNFDDISIISEAENGYEAIEKYKRYTPDIVFIDINMPGMDGLKAVEEMLKMEIPSSFVIITSYSRFDYAQKAIRLGVEEFLLKPADLNNIEKILHSVKSKQIKSRQSFELKRNLSNRVKELEPIVEKDLIDNIYSGSQLQNYSNLLNLINITMESAFVIEIESECSTKEIMARIKLQITSRGYQCISGIYEKRIVLVIIQEKPNCKIEPMEMVKYLDLYLGKNSLYKFTLGCGEKVRSPEQLAFSSKTARQSLEYAIKNEMPYCTKAELQRKYNYDFGLIDLTHLLENLQTSNIHPVVTNTINYILSQYSHLITLDQIADKLNLSTFYISKLIKKETGLNISDIITEIRIREAKRLLEDNSLNIKEITFRVGFNSQNYFSRVFKKYTGLSPSEYKNNL